MKKKITCTLLLCQESGIVSVVSILIRITFSLFLIYFICLIQLINLYILACLILFVFVLPKNNNITHVFYYYVKKKLRKSGGMDFNLKIGPSICLLTPDAKRGVL